MLKHSVSFHILDARIGWVYNKNVTVFLKIPALNQVDLNDLPTEISLYSFNSRVESNRLE